MDWVSKQNELRIVDDQISSPTWARMLAESSAQIIAQGRGEPLAFLEDKVGLYHLCGGGYCSRYGWVEEIMRQTGKIEQIKLIPAKSDDFPNPAKRPQFSVLDCSLIQETFHIQDYRIGSHLWDWHYLMIETGLFCCSMIRIGGFDVTIQFEIQEALIQLPDISRPHPILNTRKLDWSHGFNLFSDPLPSGRQIGFIGFRGIFAIPKVLVVNRWLYPIVYQMLDNGWRNRIPGRIQVFPQCLNFSK